MNEGPTFYAAFGARLQTLFAWRRDVRRFRRDTLPLGMPDRLLALADLAPSVGNAQPWRRLVLTADQQEALAEHVDRVSDAAAGGYDVERAAAYRKLKLHVLRGLGWVSILDPDTVATNAWRAVVTVADRRAVSRLSRDRQ